MAENQPKNSLGTTSSAPGCSPATKKLITEWINRFALDKHIDISSGLEQKLWEEQLGDLPPPVLNACFQETMRTHVYPGLPSVADIRSHAVRAQGEAEKTKAENAWRLAMKWVKAFYHPDLGISPHAPKLEESIVRAIVAADGIAWLADKCPDSQLHFAKDRFIAEYTNFQRLKKDIHFIDQEEAKRILDGFQSGSPPVRMLPSKTAEEMQSAPASTSVVVRKRKPLVVVRDDSRVQQQKEALRKAHPEWFPLERGTK